VEVAAYIDALGAGLGDGGEVRGEVVDALSIVLGGDAVLGDVQRQSGLGGAVQDSGRRVPR
jgi:hypothetical protein